MIRSEPDLVTGEFISDEEVKDGAAAAQDDDSELETGREACYMEHALHPQQMIRQLSSLDFDRADCQVTSPNVSRKHRTAIHIASESGADWQSMRQAARARLTPVMGRARQGGCR